ncbi:MULTISPECIES: hypothetical protein [unclassified Mesorhizobium]|uniref:hypothetical protein n=1 Tax=unclassified Mesorhizobium TaxID=325217 RepID=UPI000FD78098|nr:MULTISPECIES: hypothetical protein [unclassified Mesorhizobium]TGR47094.1 hypothetical protein EN842_22230 [bacterium M00.F.Ca.ET.199.01.1.1]TGU36547.1 hypothetical protein EN799_13010 [bacterium M00.F.Ca.ET.156.01.1.1]TGV87736.1 hypothetical protein EN792_009255 [Mesorhizobium sp. M00.F.Ca.ET.149.01.1.1]TGR28811.1 hypothetical protein EN845_10505 [Mesorhizobium sp. M8A.F.Ca.ET.202.01.1.1]TGR29965.1 hypothetical protein EN840_09850 [Mesorhizobium sp. M8A.F.Ca.ET.197.01.1.1]
MPRYATIITGDDGLEVVSAIGEFDGAAPQARLGRVEAVAPGVLIGMVRDASGGFCFPRAGIDSRAVGLAMAKLKARAGAAKPAARPKRGKRAGKKTVRSKKARSRSEPPKAAAGDALG